MINNHKIRLKKSNYIKTIDFERPTFSPDGRSFSCVVSNDYDLSTGDIVSLSINDGGAIAVKIDVERIIEQGWVELNTTFDLLDYKPSYTSYTEDGEEDKTTEWRYFIGNRGVVECGYENEDGALEFPVLGIKSVKYDKTIYPNTVTLPIRYYIEDGLINYRGSYFTVNYDDKGNVAPFQTIGNTTVYVNNKNKSEWQYKSRVNIFLPHDIEIKIDEVNSGKAEWYVTVDGIEFVLKERPITLSGYTYYEKYLPSYDALVPKDDNSDYIENLPENLDGEGIESVPASITLWDGVKRDIKSRVVSVGEGNIIILNVDTDEFVSTYQSKNIIAERVTSTNTPYYMYGDEEDSIVINDLTYEVKTVEMIDFDGHREIFPDEEEGMYYIRINSNRKIYFTKKENETQYSLLFDKTIKYEPFKRNKLEYNGREYFKEIDETESADDAIPPTQYPFILPSKSKYSFYVYSHEEPNVYYCKLTDDKNSTFSGFRDGKKQWIYSDIANNSGSYVFSLEPQKFFEDLTDPTILNDIIGFMSQYNDDPIIDFTPTVAIAKVISEMNIPIHLTTLHGTNLFQEIDVTTEFFKDKRAGAINRIVDMEKDMYFPMVVAKDKEGGETNQVKLVDAVDIEFFLHLRTRDDDWSIRDDKMIEVENMYGKNFIAQTEKELNINPENQNDYNEKYTKTSWNIMDYYDGFNIGTNDDFSYYQPSDLLGFFDFNDDDIFYQKSKVQKTFLRMSFFDTKDPQTQSLLGTSTVFFDSGAFFGKFTDKMTHPDSNIKYVSPKTWKGSSKLIGVNREALPKDGRKVFQSDNVRMSSTVSVTNKIATDNSAEGFYNYIFREYSNKLHERRIYLRIQLNHAGHGEVIDLFQPMIKGSDGKMRLAKYDQIDKNGLNFTDLYDMMFIPVNVKYDEENRKYCWYLPKELVQHDENKIKFNLYEIKVRK